MTALLIHAFLYDPGFLDQHGIVASVRNRGGGMCYPSPQSLSYFVEPEQMFDQRVTRSNSLNAIMTTKPELIFDLVQNGGTFFVDVQTVWSATEQQNLFALIDQLCFAFNVNATTQQVELSLAGIPQYVHASYVYSTTYTVANYQVVPNPFATQITCPDYVSFSYVIANSTQYQFRIWLNNDIFAAQYPLSTIRTVIPPLPLAELYTLSIVNGNSNTFATALASSQASQQALQLAFEGDYSGCYAADVFFVDSSGDTTVVQFNLLYNGTAPGSIAVTAAIRNLLLTSGVGTSAGWKAIAPSLFVTERFYLLGMWDQSTSLINSIIYPNITEIAKASTDATTVLHDIGAGFVTANLALLSSFYNRLTVISVPDPSNDPTRLSLAAEHPTYQAVATTDLVFATMLPMTQQFATLLGAALSLASGNPSTNTMLASYTAANDNRTYIVFSVGDVEYLVITRLTYLALV